MMKNGSGQMRLRETHVVTQEAFKELDIKNIRLRQTTLIEIAKVLSRNATKGLKEKHVLYSQKH